MGQPHSAPSCTIVSIVKYSSSAWGMRMSKILASNGQKGLELFRRERPDVVVLDLKIPGINGLTVLQ